MNASPLLLIQGQVSEVVAAAAAAPSSLRLFLDSASLKDWQSLQPTGVFYGITTNPLILERDKVPCTLKALTQLAREALANGAQEVQLQSFGGSTQDMTSFALKLAEIDHQNVVVRIFKYLNPTQPLDPNI